MSYDYTFMCNFAKCLHGSLARRKSNILEDMKEKPSGRFPKRQLFIALNKCKAVFPEFEKTKLKARWSVGKKHDTATQIIEYLVDYSISTFSIPQTIKQLKEAQKKLRASDSFELLLTVESELGNDDEVARDFLKLLDVKSKMRLLVFKIRTAEKQSELNQRLEWVISHHAKYDDTAPTLLMAIPYSPKADFADLIRFFYIKNKRVKEVPLLR